MFNKTDAVSFLHEKFSPSLGHGKNSLDLQGPGFVACYHLSRLAVFGGEVGKGYSIFKCLQTVRIDL